MEDSPGWSAATAGVVVIVRFALRQECKDFLALLPECGSQSGTPPPEWLAMLAHSGLPSRHASGVRGVPNPGLDLDTFRGGIRQLEERRKSLKTLFPRTSEMRGDNTRL